jgi:hypothetical protein
MSDKNDVEVVEKKEVMEIKRYSKGSDHQNSKIEEIKQRVRGVHANTTAVSTSILEKNKTKEVDTPDKLLTEAVVAMEKFMPKTGASGWFKTIISKLPFAEKIMTNIEKTVIDNMSAEESMQKLFKAFDRSIEIMNEDVNDMYNLMTALDQSKLENEQISMEIDKELAILENENKPENGFSIFSLRQMKTELMSISMINQQTADTIDSELACAETMTIKLTETKPYLGSILSAQLALSAQNTKNKRVQETMSVMTGLVNDMILEQNKSSQESIRNTLKMVNEPVISKATLTDLTKQNIQDASNLAKLIVDLKNNAIDYSKVQKQTKLQLESSKNSYNQIAYDLNTKVEQKVN